MGEKPIETLQTKRDELLDELHSVYSGAPSTTYQAYRKAQEALQKNQDMTFSDDEIDAFLPKELKKANALGFERLDHRKQIECIPAKPVEGGDDQRVASLKLLDQVL